VLIENNSVTLFLDSLIKKINESNFDNKENFYDLLNEIKSEIKNPHSEINIFITEFKQNESLDLEQLNNFIDYLISEIANPNSPLIKLFSHLYISENKTSENAISFNEMIKSQINSPNSKLLVHLNHIKHTLPLSKKQKEKIRNKIKQELANHESVLNLHLEKIREKLFESYIIHHDSLEEYLAAYPRTHSDTLDPQYYYQIETKKLNNICTQIANSCTKNFGPKFTLINAHSFNYNKNNESKWLPVKIHNSVCSTFNLNNTKSLKVPAKDIIDNLISELIFENLLNPSFDNLALHRHLQERGLPSKKKNSGASSSNTCSFKSSAGDTFKDENNNEPSAEDDSDGWSVAYRKSPIPERFIYKALEIVDKLKTKDRSVLKQGKVFKNHEKRLPHGGYYYEFDVVCEEQHGRRDAKRLVLDINKLNWWYTKDHYQSFVFDSQKDNDIIQRIMKGSKQ
jgi:guanyl-specific ribonuclease Sa